MYDAQEKYRLRRAGMHYPRGPKGSATTAYKYYQLIALRDIPEYGVRAGDYGGYVSSKGILSHEGSCWIGIEAEVIGYVSIQEDAYIGGTTSVANYFSNLPMTIKGNAQIIDDSRVRTIKVVGKPFPSYRNIISGNVVIGGNSELFNMGTVSGSVKIYEDAHLFSCKEISGNAEFFGETEITSVKSISGGVKVYDQAVVDSCEVMAGNSEIYGNAVIHEDTSILGDSKIHGSAVISKGVLIRDVEISGHIKVLPYERLFDTVINDEETLSRAMSATKVFEKPKADGILSVYEEILANIASYESDIVKIIKYPAMTDRTDPHTLQMILALNTTKRLSDKPWESEFKDSVQDLEAKFLIAESNALKLSATYLSESDKKKAETAKNLLAMAADKNANDNEKKLSFDQAFKYLEGIIVVPETAIDTFRLKIGLKELEG